MGGAVATILTIGLLAILAIAVIRDVVRGLWARTSGSRKNDGSPDYTLAAGFWSGDSGSSWSGGDSSCSSGGDSGGSCGGGDGGGGGGGD